MPSISIDNPILATEPKLAIVMGNEGDGLPRETIAEADYVVRIPMSHGIDSLNVAAAAAVLATSCSTILRLVCTKVINNYIVILH